MSSRRPDFKIYPSLLDCYQDYLDSDRNWKKFYGDKDEPAISAEDYETQCLRNLIDRINRVPFDSVAADKGTAFNVVVDCIKDNRKDDKVHVEKVKNNEGNVFALDATCNDRTFRFPLSLCREFADYYKGGISQVYTEGILPTRYGDVLLYGFIDELLPESVHDIKTTGKYIHDKYGRKWQRYVYPYCLNAEGNDVHVFEYNITDFRNTYTEYFTFEAERDVPVLTERVEGFIEFLLDNRNLITDKKIFNEA